MLFHIIEQSAWHSAQAAGSYQPPSLKAEGFIHLSKEEQVEETANRFYQGRLGLVLLGIEPERLRASLRYDDVPGHGTFPHIYGPLNLDAVVQVLPFEPSPDGTFSFGPRG